jgi:hypothetical protein
MLAGMLALLAIFSLPAAPNRQAAAESYLPWAAGFYVCFLVPILSFLSAGGIMRDDLGAASVDYVFTRPVRRPVWIVFRYLAHVGCAQISHLFALLTLIGVGMYREVPQLWAAVPLLLAGQILALIAFSAF